MRPAILTLMLVVFSVTTGEFVIAGLLLEVAAGLAVSVATAGALVTAYAIGMIVGGPVVTMLTVRLARKPLVVGLVLVSIMANLGSAVAPNYIVLLIMRGTAGSVAATLFAVAIATAVSTACPGTHAAAVAQVALGMNLGIVVGTPLGTAVGQYLGWRATFLTVALCAAVALALVLRFMPNSPGSVPGSTKSELGVFTDPSLWWALTLTAVGNLGVVMVFTYIAPLLTEVGGFAPGTVPILLLVYGLGAVVGNYVGGKLADRALLSSVTVLLAALAAVMVLLWLAGDVRPAAAPLIFVLGALAFAIIPGMQTRVISAARAGPTLAVAVNASGFQLAAAGASHIGGSILGAGWEMRSLYSMGAALTGLGIALAVYLLWRDRRARSTDDSSMDTGRRVAPVRLG